nr:choice-of-anchor J domain-containing protein [Muribaculaceae bacterium]
MQKIIISLAALASTLFAGAAESEVLLYGQLYTGTGDYSIYSFSSGSDDGFEKVADIAAEPNCGSVSTGSRFYAFSAEPGDYGNEYAAYVYDANTGYSLITRIGDAYSIAKPQQVLAYDATTSNIYTAYQESSYYGTESYLGIVNISNRTITRVGYGSLYFGYGKTYIVAMAANPDGELYAIASNSYLYKIDKTNGDISMVGSTGIYPEYEQSMTFSPDGSVIYWAACNDDIAALYSVDPATGNATKIKDFPGNQEFVSLWVGAAVVADGAPGAATALEAVFEGPSLTGELSFVAPEITHGGDALEGELSYEVFAGDESVCSGTAYPGDKVTCTVTVAEAGLVDFTVTFSNANGAGDAASLNGIYAGPDVPVFVDNLTLTAGEGEGEFIISWDAPTVGAHGGYVDASALKYRLRRLPDFTVLSDDAVSPYTDTFVSSIPVSCSYEVMPYVDENISGLPKTTESVMTGQPYEVPYAEDFASTDHIGSWTIIDGNDDGHTWDYQWDFGYYRAYDNENAKDEWLISPYVSLEAGQQYIFSADFRTIAQETVEVCAGTGLTAADMTVVVLEAETIPDTDYSWVARKVLFTVPESGRYHFGIHAMTSSPEDALALYVDNVKVELDPNSSIGTPATVGAASQQRYFNLQGVEVSRDALVPGVYIITSGE